MSVILVTGASGFIGSRLVDHLAPRHQVIALSRKAVTLPGCVAVRGDCGSFEDLRQLDAHAIDAVVHLAGETGGASEEAALGANVQGTRRLLRYLSDRGCRKFVLASSIAAAGALDTGFVPRALPIPADHPCLARDAYGLSKAMLEQLAGYFGRALPQADVTCLRFGWVMFSSRAQMPWCSAEQPPALPFLFGGQVAVADVLGGIDAVLSSPARPGSRVYNLVGPDVRAQGSVAAFLRACLGERAAGLDLAPFEPAGNACGPVFAMDGLLNDHGFRPTHSVCAG